MKQIEVTLDFETCALCPTAAVMSVGAVAWNRFGQESPFLEKDGSELPFHFYKHVDIRSEFVDGFSFCSDTSLWWSTQNAGAKKAVLGYDDEPLSPIEVVVSSLFEWMDALCIDGQPEDVYLWSQGSDFDIAILRHICSKYGLTIPVKYTNFRDHRTYFMESARVLCARTGMEFDAKKAYLLVDDYKGVGEPHNPIFDCRRSIFATWQMMNHLRLTQNIQPTAAV